MRRQNQSQNEQSDDDCTSSASQILERVQPDRVTVTKPEEDRRRRTIIVEKKNGTYGFTLQSYGIHYKKEQEIEMITYVDYVDYDGPAYRSGMREGDVILSINGTDMEKADHKTLVNFIKSCDTRMRMVVLFEDCVRKVELHIRYIQLQRILQNKMIELEKVCIKERQLLEGKWKTHSLPARKKYQNETPSSHVTYSYCRPTVSTEDVAKQQHNQQQKNQLILTYRYLEPNYYMLQPTTSSSEYLLTFDDGKSSEHHLIVKTPSDLPKKISKGNQTTNNSMIEKKKLSCNYGGNLCNPCVQSNSDNTSLEAYDLASSPCCDPRCVPTTFNQRRRNNSSKNKSRRDSKCEETQTDIEQTRIKTRPHSQASQTSPIYNSSVPKRYFHIGAGLMSQCSLHSCTSSELSCVAPTTIGESTGSYTTSLSTDTLYWNGSCDSSSRHKMKDIRYSQPPTNEPIYVQYNSVNPPIKPKSWDNLATKAFGGYGFGGGYGYIDSSGKTSKSGSIRSNSSVKNAQYVRTNNTTEKNIHPPQNMQQKTRYYTNKSTESLLSFPKYQESNSCECLNPISPIKIDNAEARFFQSPRDNVVSPTDPNFGYYSVRKQKQISTSSEATRL